MNESAEPSNGRSKAFDNVGHQEHPNGWVAFEVLGTFLEEDGWHPQRVGEQTIYRVFFGGENGDLRCYAKVDVNLELFLFYALAPIKVPDEKRLIVAEYLTRANYGLRIGKFELDFNDGEVRYKSSLDFEGETLSHAWLQHAIYPAVQTMDRYLPGLMNVLYGGVSPAEAVAEIEGQ
jgi:hypothetical protein